MSATTMTGTIRQLPIDKATQQRRGFGFIKGADGTDYFFHKSGLQQTTMDFYDLQIGHKVTFTPAEGDRGPRAVEVRVVA